MPQHRQAGACPWPVPGALGIRSRCRGLGETHLEDSKEYGPQAFLEFLNQRLAKRQRELESSVKFSSHFQQVESVVAELKSIRGKYLAAMRREGLL
jgi:hypothetical protein